MPQMLRGIFFCSQDSEYAESKLSGASFAITADNIRLLILYWLLLYVYTYTRIQLYIGYFACSRNRFHFFLRQFSGFETNVFSSLSMISTSGKKQYYIFEIANYNKANSFSEYFKNEIRLQLCNIDLK